MNRLKRWVYYQGWREYPEDTYRGYLRDVRLETDHFYRREAQR